MSEEEKTPQEDTSVETWYLAGESEAGTPTLNNIEVNNVSLHDSISSANDAVIAGGAIGSNSELELGEREDQPERVSIMDNAEIAEEPEIAAKTAANTEIPQIDQSLPVAISENPGDISTESAETIFPTAAQTPVEAHSDLSNIESAPEYLQQERLETTAEIRSGLIHDTSSYQPIDSGAGSTSWDIPPTAVAETAKPAVAVTTPLEETIFEGATVTPSAPSRAAAHLWSLLLTLVFLPMAWIYSMEVAARLRVGTASPWQGGPLTIGIVTELIGACICIFIVVFVARFSSLGAFFNGVLLTIFGLFCVATPHIASSKLGPLLSALNQGTPGERNFLENSLATIGHILNVSAGSGLFLFLGIILLALGFVSHGARRKGRKDYLITRKVEKHS